MSWFGFGAAEPVEASAARYAVGDLVWYLHFEERREPGSFPSLSEPVTLKQFRVAVVTHVRYKKQLMHTVYVIEAPGLRLNVHESFLASTPIEALDGIPVEFLETSGR